MPKNKGLGGKHFRSGKKTSENDFTDSKLEFKQDGQEYARVEKLFGNMRLQVLCNDGTLRNATIPKLFKKKVWINRDDFVLIGIREYQKDGQVDVIHKYSSDNVQDLFKLNELNPVVFTQRATTKNPDADNNESDDDIVFDTSEQKQKEEEINFDEL